MVVPAVLGLLRMSHKGSAFFVLRHILHFNYNGLNPTWGHPASCLLWQSLRSRKLGADVCLSNDGHVWQVLSPHNTHPIFGFFKETPKFSLSQAGGWKRVAFLMERWMNSKEASRWGTSVENIEGASLEGLSFTHRLCTFGVLFPFAAEDLALSEVSLHLVTEENSWGLRDKQPPTPCLSRASTAEDEWETSLCSHLCPPHYSLILSAPSWGQPAASSRSLPPTFQNWAYPSGNI